MHYVSLSQLIEDTKSFVTKLPRNKITGVIGIPKSGMIPASIIACELRVPLATLGGQFWKSTPTTGTILLVDDSIASGGEMARASKSVVLPCGCSLLKAAIYSTSPVEDYAGIVDVCYKVTSRHRAFEWNIFNHAKVYYAMADMDGVLCLDPTVHDDDGPAYQDAIRNAVLLHVPKYELAGIATGRLERWRSITEEWLGKNGITYRSLHMSQHATAHERRKAKDVPLMKAEAYKASTAKLFIESEERQAKRICHLSGKEVLSLATHSMHEPVSPVKHE